MSWSKNPQDAPDGVIVMTKNSSGDESPLKRKGNLWFLTDDSMYVYYVPSEWRHMTDRETDFEKVRLHKKAATKEKEADRLRGLL